MTLQKNQKRLVMSSKQNNRQVVHKCAICGLILAIFLSNPFFNYKIVLADSYMQDFKGSENAENPKDFNDTQDQNAWKFYSVLRSYGFTHNQAVGVMANVWHESSFVETCVESDSRKDAQAVVGVDRAGVDLAKGFDRVHNEYAETVGLADGGHRAASGDYYVGIGLCQWTADRGYKLVQSFCKDNHAEWWITETQLTFLITDEWETKLIKDFLSATDASTSCEECARKWAQIFEICAGANGPEGNQRASLASQYSSKFPENWDKTYGDKICSGAGLTINHRRDGIYDRSMLHEFTAPALVYPWNAGILTSNNTETMEANNTEVWKGYINSLQGKSDNSKTYSLFELYGEDLHWYRYLGESTVAPTIADHIYSGVTQGKKDQLVGEIVARVDYQPADYLSTQVYDGRPRTLTYTEVWQGYVDPRVNLEVWSRWTGYFYVSGSFSLTIAKFIQSFICLLLGKELLVDAADVLTAVETSDEWQLLIPAINCLMVFAILALIVSLVKNTIKYARGTGGAPPYAVITRFCIAIGCMVLIWTCFYNPAKMNDAIVKALGCVDDIFNASLAKNLADDEVIAVKDKDMSTRAAIWKTCIFEPWCRGQFDGLEYEQLYTNYATLPSATAGRLYQSNQTAEDVEGNVTSPYFNSTQLTGDVYVPVGGGKKIRNWAAYLYSCGSKYHIDSSLNSADDLENLTADTPNFPNAKTTAFDSGIYADTFRIVDAQMNISPQYFADGEIINNYTDARVMKNHFLAEGAVVMINALLLLWFVPAIYQKIKNFILIIITCLQCIYYSFIELFKENTGLKNLGASLKKAVAGYFIADIKIYVMVVLYMNFVDKGFIKMILYCFLCLTVLCLTLNDVKSFASKAYNGIKNSVDRARSLRQDTDEKRQKIREKKEELRQTWARKSNQPTKKS